MIKIVYYAHCLAIYDTPQEQRDIELLKSLGFEVYNPNCEEASAAYKQHGMNWFLDKVASCDAVAFRSLPSGKIPAGIYKEVNHAIERRIPVIELPSRLSQRELTVEQTREYLQEIGLR